MLAATLTANAQGSIEAMLNYAGTTPSGGTPISSAIYASFNGPMGWTFQPLVNINVTALGAFSYIVPGAGGVKVGLWDASGSLLASNTITTASTLDNQSRYKTVTPVLLTAGQTYYLAAYIPLGQGSPIAVTPSSEPYGYATMSSEIQLGMVAYSQNSGFSFPGTTDGYTGCAIIAPNFQYTVVPEPSTLGLLGGGAGLWLIRVRRQIKARAAGV